MHVYRWPFKCIFVTGNFQILPLSEYKWKEGGGHMKAYTFVCVCVGGVHARVCVNDIYGLLGIYFIASGLQVYLWQSAWTSVYFC